MDALIARLLQLLVLVAFSSASWLPDLEEERHWPGPGPGPLRVPTKIHPQKVHVITHGQSGLWNPHKNSRQRTGSGQQRSPDQSHAAQSYPPLDKYRMSEVMHSTPHGLMYSSTLPPPGHRYSHMELSSSTARPLRLSLPAATQNTIHHIKHHKKVKPKQEQQQQQSQDVEIRVPSSTTSTTTTTSTTEKPGPDPSDIHRQLQKQLSQQIQMQLEQLQRLHELQHKMLEVPKSAETTTASSHERSTETIKRSVANQQPQPSQQNEQLVPPPQQSSERPPLQQEPQEQQQESTQPVEQVPYVDNYRPATPLFGSGLSVEPTLSIDPSPPPLLPFSSERPRYPEEMEPLETFLSSPRSSADSGFFPLLRYSSPSPNDVSKELYRSDDGPDAESFLPFVENATDPALPYFLLPPAPERESQYHSSHADAPPPPPARHRHFSEGPHDSGPFPHSAFSSSGPSEVEASASDSYEVPQKSSPRPKKRLRPPR